LQRIQNSDKNSKEKKYKENTKEVNQSDFSRNQNSINDAIKFNHVALQT